MARTEHFKKLQTDKTEVKCFLLGGTMLTGKIVNFDDECLILNKCLIFYDKIISVTPA